MKIKIKKFIANLKKKVYLQKDKFSIQLALKKHKLNFMIPAFNSLFGDKGKEEKKLAEAIESMRSEMAEREGSISVFASAKPGSFDPRIQNKPAHGTVKKFNYRKAAFTGVTKEWGLFLHYLVKNKPSNYIMEMGSCSGFSACYIASANNFQKFLTIEASTELCEIAKNHIQKFSERFVVINKLFDDAIDDFLQQGLSGIDIVYIDGHHEKLATLHYFDRIKPMLNPDALVIFDDIYWSQDMNDGWNIIKSMHGVKFSIDVGRFGLCIWNSAVEKPIILDFHTKTGTWKMGKGKY